MSGATLSEGAADEIREHRDDLEDLAESDLPAAKYADMLLDMLGEEQNQ